MDTRSAFYVWEHPYYPQYAVPADGLPAWLLQRARPAPPDDRLHGYVVLRFDTTAAWYEEEERVYGHPRNPYVRVDALRAQRSVTVLLRRRSGGPRVLARTTAPVGVFETSLPPRWYVDPACVDWSLLTPSETVAHCPYKGQTTGYWSTDETPDVAWTYGSPQPAVHRIAGMIAFDDTKLEVQVEP